MGQLKQRNCTKEMVWSKGVIIDIPENVLIIPRIVGRVIHLGDGMRRRMKNWMDLSTHLLYECPIA